MTLEQQPYLIGLACCVVFYAAFAWLLNRIMKGRTMDKTRFTTIDFDQDSKRWRVLDESGTVLKDGLETEAEARGWNAKHMTKDSAKPDPVPMGRHRTLD